MFGGQLSENGLPTSCPYNAVRPFRKAKPGKLELRAVINTRWIEWEKIR